MNNQQLLSASRHTSLQSSGFRRFLSAMCAALVLLLPTAAWNTAHAQPGSLDPTFAQTGIGFNGNVRGLAVQSDGKILAGGDFTSYKWYRRTAHHSLERRWHKGRFLQCRYRV